MTQPVKLLVAGLPAELVREIGLRLRGVDISSFENAQQIGRAAAHGEARLVILSDALPTEETIYIARRAKDASDEMKVAYCMSMQQAENGLRAVKDIQIDRFFLTPIDKEEMLLELAKMSRVEVLAPHESHGQHIAAAVFEAWERARPSTWQSDLPARRSIRLMASRSPRTFSLSDRICWDLRLPLLRPSRLLRHRPAKHHQRPRHHSMNRNSRHAEFSLSTTSHWFRAV